MREIAAIYAVSHFCKENIDQVLTPGHRVLITVFMSKHRTKLTVDLPRALKHVGIERSRFNYLYGHGRSDGTSSKVLETEYSEPTGGAARRISIENLLELAFIWAATEAGFNLMGAVILRKRWLAEYRKGTLAAWYVWGREGEGQYFSEEHTKMSDGSDALAALGVMLCEKSNKTGSPEIDAHLPQSTRYIRAINLGEIVRRAEGLLQIFGEETPWQAQ